MTEKFDPNDHSAKNRFTVYIKRLKQEYEVTYINSLLSSKYKNHLWGFAKDEDGDSHEWDVTWGDTLKQNPIEE